MNTIKQHIGIIKGGRYQWFYQMAAVLFGVVLCGCGIV